MSIKNRIIISSLILLTLFIMTGVVNWIGQSSVMEKTDLAYQLENEMMHLQGIFRGINEFIIDEAEPLSIELTETHLEGFDNLHNGLMAKDLDPEMKEVLSGKIEPQWTIVKEGAVSFMKNNPWISVEDDTAMLQYGKLTTEAHKLLEEVGALALSTKEVAEATAKKTKYIVNAVGSVILLIIAGLLLSLYRSITAPIKELNIMAEGFKNGDLSVLMDDSRKDEFGKLASHLNAATAKLSHMISNVKQISGTLHANTEKLSAIPSISAGERRSRP